MAKEYYLHSNHLEHEVRKKLNIPEGRPIMDDDLKKVTQAVFEWEVTGKDAELLYGLTGVKELCVDTSEKPLFLKNMPDLEDLDIKYFGDGEIDCNHFTHLEHLKALCIAGEMMQTIPVINTDSLAKLSSLKELTLFDLKDVDLGFLEQMTQLESFSCEFINGIKNVEAIGFLKELKYLSLVDFDVEDIEFLKPVDNEVELDICSLWFPEGFDESKLEELNRFKHCQICELWVGTRQIAFEINKR